MQINCCLSALLIQRILKIEFKWPFVLVFFIYCYLLFSQSYFYTFYTQDVLSHLSYLFLITGACLFYFWNGRRWIIANCILAILCLIAFLCKETYGLAAMVFAGIWFLYAKRKPLLPAILPLLMVGGALAIVMAFNLVIKSTFINLNSGAADPYYINRKPASIFREMCIYAREGLNILDWGIIVIIGFLVCLRRYEKKDKKVFYIFWGCILAALSSWLPNALIPNHHSGGYSFNGAYLIYLPIILTPLLWYNGPILRALVIAMLIAGITSPVFNQKEYAKQWWVLEQENTERHLLKSLDTLMNGIKPMGPNQHILLTGLTMPFYPFHHPKSLKVYPNMNFATYDVVCYPILPRMGRYDQVKFIKPSDVLIKEYTSVWMFAGNGALIGTLDIDSVVIRAIEKSNCLDLVLYPDSVKNTRLASIIK